MITFNGPRPVRGDDGRLTYTERAKNGLIGVVIAALWFVILTIWSALPSM